MPNFVDFINWVSNFKLHFRVKSSYSLKLSFGCYLQKLYQKHQYRSNSSFTTNLNA